MKIRTRADQGGQPSKIASQKLKNKASVKYPVLFPFKSKTLPIIWLLP